MTAITKTAILNWFNRYSRDAPSGANRVLTGLKTILNYAVKAEVFKRSPANEIILNQTKKMTQFLSDDERARLLTALDQVEDRYQIHAEVIRLLLSTGCRKGEVLHLRWDEVATNTLTLIDSKTGPQTVWVGGEALAIIDRQRQKRGGSAYVFPHRHDAVKGYHGWYCQNC